MRIEHRKDNWKIIPPEGLRRGIADIESNGLLDTITKIHSATWEDLDTGESFSWGPLTKQQFLDAEYALNQDHPAWKGYRGNIAEFYQFLATEVGVVIGHNFVDFDARAISLLKDLYGAPDFSWDKIVVFDTLIFCKMIWPADALIGPDMKRYRSGRMPGQYLKRQSLGAWGYRLGNYKGEYDGGWETWTPAMHEYMVQDGKVNLDLWRLIEKRIGWDAGWTEESGVYQWPALPFWIEHEFAKIIDKQEADGVYFNKEYAVELIQELKNRQADLSEKLKVIFGSWWAPLDNPEKGRTPTKDRTRKCTGFPDVVEKRFGAKGQELKPYVGPPKEYYTAGAPYCRVEYTEFNPNSRRHLADRLQRVFGWTPTVFTPTGEAQVDEGAIKNIPDGVIDPDTRQVILDYFLVTKTLGQVGEGTKSWMAYFNEKDHCIHGIVDPLGTITTRGAHRNPNLGQVISVKVEEIKDDTGKVIKKVPLRGIAGGYGLEARSCFTSRPGRELTGSDCSSLEFIWLGHDLAPYDGGAFSARACNPDGDLHAENGADTGLARRDAKTCGYAYIFGAGAPNIGEQVGLQEGDDPEAMAMDDRVIRRIQWMKRVMGRDFKEPDMKLRALICKGYDVIAKFEAGIVGIKDLKKALSKLAEEQGYIIAIDGRKLLTRKAHAALNTRLQGNGAITCKLWCILMWQRFKELGIADKIIQVLWVHDEYQFDHEKGLGPTIRKVSDEAVKETGKMLKLHGELRTETKTGLNWADTH